MTLLTDLALEPVINGVGPATRLGGLPLAAEVLDAMSTATAISVRMDELLVAVGMRLAARLEVPGVYVTSGASAALTLAAAAVVEPGAPIPRTEVIIQAAHSDPYDRALSLAGARLTHIGYPGSTHPAELRRAIGPSTAAVAFRPGRDGNLLDLRTVSQMAHEAGVPVIVDGALFVPPVDKLQAMFADGADLVAVSGGKGFRGPQASGLLCGSPELLDRAAFHHQDLDERTSTWSPLSFDGTERRGENLPAPRHGLGRGMKVGREQIVGLLAAVERYLTDPGGDERSGIAELALAEAELRRCEGLDVVRAYDSALDVPVLHLDFRRAPVPVDDVVRLLDQGRPRVVLGEDLAWAGQLTVNPMALLSGQGLQLAAAVAACLAPAVH